MNKPINRLLFIQLILAIGSIALCKRAFRKHYYDKKDSIKIKDQTAFNSYGDDNQGTAKADDGKASSDFYFHKVLLVIIMIFVWGFASYYFVVDILAITGVWVIPISLLLFITIAFTIAATIYLLSVKYPISKDVKIKKLHWFFQFALFIASPSWSFARLFKNKLKSKSKERKTKTDKDGLALFISSINGTNLIVSAFMAVIGFLMYNTWMADYLMTIIVLRTLSRSFEITLAFGNDALDTNKSSLLNSYQRLMLAFTSLFECIINYTIAYYLVGLSVGERICKWQAFVHSFQSAFFYINKLLDNSLSSTTPTALSMLQVTQVITCMTLVFIAFVIYISKTTSDNNNDQTSKSRYPE